jgi:hypothetical protein
MKKARHITGPKLNGRIKVEGSLESVLCMVLMIDPRVVEIRPQPVTFDLNSGRRFETRESAQSSRGDRGYRPRIYTPDFAAKLSSGEEVFLEAKHSVLLASDESISARPGELAEFGERLIIVTDELLWKPLRHNVRHLKRELSVSVGKGSTLQDIEQPCSISELITRRRVPQSEVLRALLLGHLKTDIVDQRIDLNTVVAPASGNTSHLEVLQI